MFSTTLRKRQRTLPMSDPKNFMDYVPRRNRNYQYEVDKDGKVTILVKWTGPYHKIATVLFKKPEVSRIDLDEIGSWVWLAMDGLPRRGEAGRKARPVPEDPAQQQIHRLQRPSERGINQKKTACHRSGRQFLFYGILRDLEALKRVSEGSSRRRRWSSSSRVLPGHRAPGRSSGSCRGAHRRYRLYRTRGWPFHRRSQRLRGTGPA